MILINKTSKLTKFQTILLYKPHPQLVNLLALQLRVGPAHGCRVQPLATSHIPAHPPHIHHRLSEEGRKESAWQEHT